MIFDTEKEKEAVMGVMTAMGAVFLERIKSGQKDEATLKAMADFLDLGNKMAIANYGDSSLKALDPHARMEIPLPTPNGLRAGDIFTVCPPDTPLYMARREGTGVIISELCGLAPVPGTPVFLLINSEDADEILGLQAKAEGMLN